MKKLFLIVLISLLALPAPSQATVANTQEAPFKIGSADVFHILSQLPETHKADAECKSYEVQLMKVYQKKMNVLQKKAEIFQKKYTKMSKKEQEKQTMELHGLQQELQKFYYDMHTKLTEKRKTLLMPVHQKIQDAIIKVSKEHGYTHIFNNQPNTTSVVLYMPEGTDISELVIKKLLAVAPSEKASKKAAKPNK